MDQSDNSLMRMIIDIMEIQEEPEYIEDLRKWVYAVGIDVVFHKIIKMYSLSLH